MNELEMPASSVGRLEKLASGATAVVYRAPDLQVPGETGPFVYKKYKSKIKVSRGSLTALARLRTDMVEKQRREFDRRAAWPLRTVIDEDRAVGVVMREIPGVFQHDMRFTGSPTANIRPLELQYVVQDAEYCRSLGVRFLSDLDRAILLADLARGLAMVHRAGAVYGDYSARNAVVRLDPKPRGMLVDCDAARVKGSAPALGKQPHTPGWEPPEVLAAHAVARRAGGQPDAATRAAIAVQTHQTDVYKFALAVIRVLTPCAGNTTNRNPATMEAKLHPFARSALRRSLGKPAERPTMREWYYAIQGQRPPG